MRALRLATGNPNKVREVRDLLRDVAVRIDTLADAPVIAEPDETATTFDGNARLKARYYAGQFPGEMVVSEDSGLEIDALDGAPGVRSARFLGPDATYAARFDEILRRLTGVPEAQRTARFVCALAVAEGDLIRFESRGVVEGLIALAPAGSGGFGYDPLFFYPPLQQTLAEVGPAKQAVSHRGQAVAALARWLRNLE